MLTKLIMSPSAWSTHFSYAFEREPDLRQSMTAAVERRVAGDTRYSSAGNLAQAMIRAKAQSQARLQCAQCRHQVSPTSGTILHRTKIPLTHWFWAAYLMTTDKRGVSALLLQRQLGPACYETTWMMLHKLRRAMVNTAREPLRGEIEMDEAWIGAEQAGLRGSRQLKDRRAALVPVAVEKRGRASGRTRMRVIADAKSVTIRSFGAYRPRGDDFHRWA